jgi:hypothetical protein
MGPSVSIAAIAGFELLGGLGLSFVCGFLVWGGIQQYHFTKQFFTSVGSSWCVFFGILPLCFSLLGIATSIGLFRLREWARKVTIFLSTVPVVSCGLLLLLNPKWVYPRAKPGEQYAILTIGSGFEYHKHVLLFLILIPLSIWWLVVLTRQTVRSQFR